jgi:hypothetical protein
MEFSLNSLDGYHIEKDTRSICESKYFLTMQGYMVIWPNRYQEELK